MKSKGWFLKNIREFELVEREVSDPAENEVIIEVVYAGICGSDLHAYVGEHPLIATGKILGHEFVGRIVKKGRKVKELEVGDPVVIEPSLTCGKCYNCTHGRYNICYELDVIGCTKTDGGFQNYIKLPANKVYKIEGIPLKRAVLTEPFAVSIHGVRRSSFKPGDEVLVVGCGPIGFFVITFLYFSGAGKIVAIDLLKERLERVRKFFPNVVTKKLEEYNPSVFHKGGPDVVFECVGNDAAINFAIDNVRKGGEVILMGVPKSKTTAKLIFVQDREIDLRGSLMYTKDDYLIALNLLKNPTIDYDSLITNIFEFEKLPEAFEYVLENKNKVFKVLVKVSSEA